MYHPSIQCYGSATAFTMLNPILDIFFLQHNCATPRRRSRISHHPEEKTKIQYVTALLYTDSFNSF